MQLHGNFLWKLYKNAFEMCCTKHKQINKRQINWLSKWSMNWTLNNKFIFIPEIQTWVEIRWENTLSPRMIIDYSGNLEAWS